MIEFENQSLNGGPNRQYQVTIRLGAPEEWGNHRRVVGLLTKAEIEMAKKSFIENNGDDHCWGDRAFSLFPERFNPR